MEIKEVLQLYDYMNDKEEDSYELLKEIENRLDRYEYYLDEIISMTEEWNDLKKRKAIDEPFPETIDPKTLL